MATDGPLLRLYGDVGPRFALRLWHYDPLSFYLPALPRYISYNISGQTDLEISELSIINTLAIVATNTGIFLSNFKAISFPHRWVSLICVLGISLCTLSISFCNQFYHFVLLYGIVYGLFIGYGYMAPLKNCYDHLPNRKGKLYISS